MLRAILNKSWRQHPTKKQLYGYLPPITKTIQVRWTRYAEHCWKSKDKLICDVLQWIPLHGRPARTYIQQLCADKVCDLEGLPEVMDDREEGRERVRDIHADGVTWWWCYEKSVAVEVRRTRSRRSRKGPLRWDRLAEEKMSKSVVVRFVSHDVYNFNLSQRVDAFFDYITFFANTMKKLVAINFRILKLTEFYIYVVLQLSTWYW